MKMKAPMLAALVSLALPTSLAAQQNEEQTPSQASAPSGGPPDSVFDDTYATIGLGVSLGPSYDGSNDYRVSVLPVITGAIEGFELIPRGPGVAVDLIRDADDAKIEFVGGVVATANLDRVNDIDDPVVEQLGDLDAAIELGVIGGIEVNRVLNPFDKLSFTLDAKWDVAGAHGGQILQPSVSYFTPVSRGAAVQLAISAEHVSDDYNDFYYSIDAAGSVASGLPQFEAEGGFRNVGASVFGVIDLDGNALNGGFGIIAIAGYSRLLGDAKRSPVTSIRGSADQFFGALGVGYTF